MENTVQAIFDPNFFNQVYIDIKCTGVVRTREHYITQGLHPSFVRAIIRRIMATRGW